MSLSVVFFSVYNVKNNNNFWGRIVQYITFRIKKCLWHSSWWIQQSKSWIYVHPISQFFFPSNTITLNRLMGYVSVPICRSKLE